MFKDVLGRDLPAEKDVVAVVNVKLSSIGNSVEPRLDAQGLPKLYVLDDIEKGVYALSPDKEMQIDLDDITMREINEITDEQPVRKKRGRSKQKK